MDVAAELVRPNRIEVAFDQVQVALNIPPYDHHPGRPHIDGYAADQVTPGTFTMLAGRPTHGPVSTRRQSLGMARHSQRSRCLLSRKVQLRSPTPRAIPTCEPGEPVQIHGQRGDVIFAHYLLGHNIGGNFQSVDTRKALYRRLEVPGHAASWYSSLSDPWHEFPILCRSAMKLDVNHT